VKWLSWTNVHSQAFVAKVIAAMNAALPVRVCVPSAKVAGRRFRREERDGMMCRLRHFVGGGAHPVKPPAGPFGPASGAVFQRALSSGLGHHSVPKWEKGKLLVMINAHEVTLASGPESVITHF
jgi:hypothetical protein